MDYGLENKSGSFFWPYFQWPVERDTQWVERNGRWRKVLRLEPRIFSTFTSNSLNLNPYLPLLPGQDWLYSIIIFDALEPEPVDCFSSLQTLVTPCWEISFTSSLSASLYWPMKRSLPIMLPMPKVRGRTTVLILCKKYYCGLCEANMCVLSFSIIVPLYFPLDGFLAVQTSHVTSDKRMMTEDFVPHRLHWERVWKGTLHQPLWTGGTIVMWQDKKTNNVYLDVKCDQK